ncbi:hypothetical protein LOTGIDRAFT_232014 [Lottia gigantea]|uniref:Glutamyl-tRNA(Gln) amidotransferase subunit C, mitochondrial n=1 Tax=Lottia gigantea TaxID=225164 RepID=V3ZUY2_LOTGI|nr:hypothetical protein LOTGIDRAFT_232014 [Lottia gigantea]ESO95308.1 hypothetical protein LOTGIDRAFT_232014 [Lottia gigantea]
MKPFSNLQYAVTASRLANAVINRRELHKSIPPAPTWKLHDKSKFPQVKEITKKQVDQLERLGLVELNNEEGIKSLSEAIESANGLYVVETSTVKPLDTVLETMPLYLRVDEMNDGNCKKDVLKNAAKVEEDYFVAPPGNIPLKSTDKG